MLYEVITRILNMNNSQESFLGLVKQAYTGKLQLPAFQRDWKWENSKVISLYDSLRKQYPIGSFLFLKKSFSIDFCPRAFAATKTTEPLLEMERLALDGQQRITAGIALLYGLQSKYKYYIDIEVILNLFNEKNLIV